MIKKLKIRFIVLAMTSLVVLMTVIVAGMNIVNYQKVVSDADTRLEELNKYSDRIFSKDDSDAPPDPADGTGMMPQNGPEPPEGEKRNDDLFGGDGRGGPSMSRDEAEEQRFFVVTVDESGNVEESKTDRIASVDAEEAETFAEKALASGSEKGFVDEFRFGITETNGVRTITFLDCGRVLSSFRDFLKYSILISLLGLVVMFGVISYFAGRIVRPVAESYEKQKRFITDAGHEIKTPLAIIKANIDVVNMELDDVAEDPSKTTEDDVEEIRDSLGDINAQVDRLTGLTNDLVYLSRLEEVGNSLVMTEVPFSDIVTEAADSFRPLAKEKGIRIETEIEPMLTVQGSQKELDKLLSIVLENAIKYSPEPRCAEIAGNESGMPAPPAVQIKLKRDGRNAVLSVTNETETEQKNEDLSHVFERFYRTDGSRNSETGGHGIGLSMASAIVNAHGGRISAHTVSGREFIITAGLPVKN